ncbi:hypothetical protein P691DRAFT_782025 [Macrolepiota fuliginosa MF-IS2]|uniref:Uncharacterized protein n=1 Tax=Macrolepiota fuliginosa MF-IS2 TaxID=1400762 RepID=A0A9P5XDS4_9AGAR|nr:hypothetical protein P691DRAFT_782025 [Macrolepiota fuliginosa MF-IS2]
MHPTEEVPRNHKIHIRCFIDTPAFTQRLLEHFPNLYTGITGAITYTTNPNTSAVISHLSKTYPSEPLRIFLEGNVPYMPSFVAQIAHSAGGTPEDRNAEGNMDMKDDNASGWDAERVMRDVRD